MSGSGWIRLHRKALVSRVFSDDWLWRLWSWCLLNAGWKTCWKHGCEIPAGGFATVYRQAAEQLSVSPSKVFRGLRLLQEWGQIGLDVKHGFSVITICNWETYQCDTDQERNTDETRMKHGRNTDETPPLREEGEEPEDPPFPPRGGLSAEPTRGPSLPEFVEAWNGVPGFTKARLPFNAKRERHFRARCRDPVWVRDWRQALEKASAKPFCLGHNDRGWVATVDWFLRPDVVSRLMEGNYLSNGKGPPPKPPETEAERKNRTAAQRRQGEQDRDRTGPPEVLRGKLPIHRGEPP